MTSPNPIDRAAFDLAIEMARKDAVRRLRIERAFERGESFVEVGKAAAYHCQIDALGLMP